MTSMHYKKILLTASLVLSVHLYVFAETVTGGGYILEQNVAPIQGAISGNGFTVQQSSQVQDGKTDAGGYTVFGTFGASTSTVPPTTNGPITSSAGYFIFPNATSSTSTLTVDTGSTCSSRIVFSKPIDVQSSTNVKADVVKLEIFLNTYENENLPVNGIYEKNDIIAVKRWQLKYRSFILDPLRLKNPTGTIYALSQRQIERQTTKTCGQQVVITVCPYLKDYVSYGDRGDKVIKIQRFLNIMRGEKLPLSGVYGPLTQEATKRFQRAYKKDILNIFTLSFISGSWNEATRIKANQVLGCDIVK